MRKTDSLRDAPNRADGSATLRSGSASAASWATTLRSSLCSASFPGAGAGRHERVAHAAQGALTAGALRVSKNNVG
jgi:hypothetical protein